MPIDVKALAHDAFLTAKTLVPDAFPICTVRLGPTPAVNPVTEVDSTTWDVELSGPLFGFDDADEREDLPAEKRQKSFLLDPVDFPAGTSFDRNGEVTDEDGNRWTIYRADRAPAKAVVILNCWR